MPLPKIIEITVKNSGNETVDGIKKFSKTIDGSITGNSDKIQSDIDAAYAAISAAYIEAGGTLDG